MLNRLADLVRLRTFANAGVQPIARANLAALDDLSPGDTVRAQVEAALPDGTFRVAIRKEPFVLRLPFAAQSGDTLRLTLVTREPHIEFALAAAQDSGEPSARLSETARFITALLDESEKLPLASIARSEVPLLTGAPDDSRQTALALRDALAHSGMFYEAHQALWAGGERTLAALLREPQARLKPLSRPATPAHIREIEPFAAVLADEAPHLPQLPVHRDALALIKQQLDTLESRHIAWHGMIWQGQPLDWEVDEPPHAAHACADAPPWRTRLRLTLPQLGRIDATLLVSARGVSIALGAASADTRRVMADERAILQNSLCAAGVTPLGISVAHDESA
jgi:hypothetical protein